MLDFIVVSFLKVSNTYSHEKYAFLLPFVNAYILY